MQRLAGDEVEIRTIKNTQISRERPFMRLNQKGFAFWGDRTDAKLAGISENQNHGTK